MSTAEYIATFASIVVGLAFADLLMSLHRLIRSRRLVQWDWLPIASAALVLLTIVQVWWRSFGVWTAQPVFSFGQFLPDLLSLTLLFLLAASALPDDIPETGMNLRKYYEENRAYFWGLFGVYVLVVSVIRFWRRTAFDASFLDFLAMNRFNLISVVFMFLLIFTRRRWVHAAVVLVSLLFLASTWVRLTISG